MKKIDFLLFFVSIGLSAFSALFVYSSSVNAEGEIESVQFSRQLLFIVVGIILMFLVCFFPVHKIKNYIPFLYGIIILALILTLFLGEIRNGARSWISIGGFSLQISEFSKLAVVLMYAYLIERYLPNLSIKRNILYYSIIGIIPMAIILLQPDMGTALVYIPIMLFVFYLSGASGKDVLFIGASGAVAIITLIIAYSLQKSVSGNADAGETQLLRSSYFYAYIGVLVTIIVLSKLGHVFDFMSKVFWYIYYVSGTLATGGILAYIATSVLKPYQMKRLLVFVNPESDPLGSGWHILQSVSAIGSGGIIGEGLLRGRQSTLQFLPQTSTDFIFSLIGEELGFLGSITVLILYAFLMWRIIIIGMASKTIFSRICCAGILAMFFTHFMVNIGMTLGIMPVTGIPLLLLSYGGSSIMTAFMALGIIQSIARVEVNSTTLLSIQTVDIPSGT